MVIWLVYQEQLLQPAEVIFSTRLALAFAGMTTTVLKLFVVLPSGVLIFWPPQVKDPLSKRPMEVVSMNSRLAGRVTVTANFLPGQ